MRYAANNTAYAYWWNGRQYYSGPSTWELTMTRRGSSLAFRLVRGNRKTRWVREFSGSALAEQARVVVDRALRRAGYRVVGGDDIKLPPVDPLLVWKAQCFGRDGDDARLVYADLLTERRDPRGELIVAQAAAEDDPEARFTVDQLLKKNRATFYGPLDETHSIVWRRGFIDDLTLSQAPPVDEYDTRPSVDLPGLLAEVLTHPSGELVRSLTIYFEPRSNIEDRTLTDTIAILTALAPPGLENLVLEELMPSAPGRDPRCDLGALLTVLPRIRTVSAMQRVSISPFASSSLTELALQGPLDDADVAALETSVCPALRRPPSRQVNSSQWLSA